jgi:hypothetical protein
VCEANKSPVAPPPYTVYPHPPTLFQVVFREGEEDTAYPAVRSILPMVTGVYKWRLAAQSDPHPLLHTGTRPDVAVHAPCGLAHLPLCEFVVERQPLL